MSQLIVTKATFVNPASSRVAPLLQRGYQLLLWGIGPRARQAYGVLVDQLLVSLGNFGTGVLLIRYLTDRQFGSYSLLLETVLFLNGLQAALVNYPLTIHCAASRREKAGPMAGAAIVLTALLSPVLILAVALAAGTARLGICIATAMIAWQLQETLRRTLIAQLRIAPCLVGDAVSYLGQIGVLFALHRLGALTVSTAFLSIACTSLAAAIIQAIQVRIQLPSLARLWRVGFEYWKLGRWTLLANLTPLITTLLVLWTLKATHGPEAIAAFAAMVLMLKLTNPIGMGLGGLITPAVAAVHASRGARVAAGIGIRYTLLGVVILLPYYAVLCFAPRWSMGVILGRNSSYLVYAPQLWLVVVFFFMSYLGVTLGACLTGLSESRAFFVAQLAQVAAVLLIVWPSTWRYGEWGLIVGGIFGWAASDIVTLLFISRACGVRGFAELRRSATSSPAARPSGPACSSSAAEHRHPDRRNAPQEAVAQPAA